MAQLYKHYQLECYQVLITNFKVSYPKLCDGKYPGIETCEYDYYGRVCFDTNLEDIIKQIIIECAVATALLSVVIASPELFIPLCKQCIISRLSEEIANNVEISVPKDATCKCKRS